MHFPVLFYLLVSVSGCGTNECAVINSRQIVDRSIKPAARSFGNRAFIKDGDYICCSSPSLCCKIIKTTPAVTKLFADNTRDIKTSMTQAYTVSTGQLSSGPVITVRTPQSPQGTMPGYTLRLTADDQPIT